MMLISALTFLTGAAAAILAIPVVVFSTEILAAICGRSLRKPVAVDGPGRRVLRAVVLVPAHDESTSLLPTLGDIKRQLGPRDRVLVVADNCSDDTAHVAAQAGAEVIERHEPGRRGKGFALDWGIRHLERDPPDVVIVVDADCRLADGTLEQLTMVAGETLRPVQARYIMTAPQGSARSGGVAEFAWMVKNYLRPLGLQKMQLPCQLMGTGMAFPWAIIKAADLASGEIVEDLKLGLDLARQGHPPLFCPSAVVTSAFPQSLEGAKTQRRRWETGHVRLMRRIWGQLLSEPLGRASVPLYVLALDLLVPPLSLLIMLLCASVALGTIAALGGASQMPLVIALASCAVFLIAAVAAWANAGRQILPFAVAASIPRYIVGKLGIYVHALSRRADHIWIRTHRD